MGQWFMLMSCSYLTRESSIFLPYCIDPPTSSNNPLILRFFFVDFLSFFLSFFVFCFRANSDSAAFVTLKTAGGRSLKVTPDHLVPAGDCSQSSASLEFTRADAIESGMCLNTVKGLDKVIFVSTSMVRERERDRSLTCHLVLIHLHASTILYLYLSLCLFVCSLLCDV
jgi:hypothetical protein